MISPDEPALFVAGRSFHDFDNTRKKRPYSGLSSIAGLVASSP